MQTVGVRSGQKHFFFTVNSDHPKSCLDKNENDMLRIFHIKVISFTVLSTEVPYLKSTNFTFHIMLLYIPYKCLLFAYKNMCIFCAGKHCTQPSNRPYVFHPWNWGTLDH
jgi:hypothetical protein